MADIRTYIKNRNKEINKQNADIAEIKAIQEQQSIDIEANAEAIEELAELASEMMGGE